MGSVLTPAQVQELHAVAAKKPIVLTKVVALAESHEDLRAERDAAEKSLAEKRTESRETFEAFMDERSKAVNAERLLSEVRADLESLAAVLPPPRERGHWTARDYERAVDIGSSQVRLAMMDGRGTSAADADEAQQSLGHHESVGERQGRQPRPSSIEAALAEVRVAHQQLVTAVNALAWNEIDGRCWCEESPEISGGHGPKCESVRAALAAASDGPVAFPTKKRGGES